MLKGFSQFAKWCEKVLVAKALCQPIGIPIIVFLNGEWLIKRLAVWNMINSLELLKQAITFSSCFIFKGIYWTIRSWKKEEHSNVITDRRNLLIWIISKSLSKPVIRLP